MFLLLNFWNNESSKYICEINFLASKWTLYGVYRVEKGLLMFCVLSLKVSWAKAPGHNILWISPGEAYSIFAYFSRPLFHSKGPFVVIFFMLYKKVMPEPNYTIHAASTSSNIFFHGGQKGKKFKKWPPWLKWEFFFFMISKQWFERLANDSEFCRYFILILKSNLAETHTWKRIYKVD